MGFAGTRATIKIFDPITSPWGHWPPKCFTLLGVHGLFMVLELNPLGRRGAQIECFEKRKKFGFPSPHTVGSLEIWTPVRDFRVILLSYATKSTLISFNLSPLEFPSFSPYHNQRRFFEIEKPLRGPPLIGHDTALAWW